MRTFVSLRRRLGGNEALSRKLAELERRLESHDSGIKSLFDAIPLRLDDTAPATIDQILADFRRQNS